MPNAAQSTSSAANTSNLTLASNASFTWGPLRMSSGGSGDMKMCWCAKATNDCLSAGDFNVDTGTLDIIGPYRGTQQVCVAGRVCHFDDFYGHRLSDGSFLRIFDEECAVGATVHGFADPEATSLMSTRDGQEFDFGLLNTNTSGGLYRMCWCSPFDPCIDDGEFIVDAGTLIIP